jgi:hypothetical protein
VRVERVVLAEGRAIETLQFRSGRRSRDEVWAFVCPGRVQGPGPRAPARALGPDVESLCPSKYASPLVAAVGAHPRLPGAGARVPASSQLVSVHALWLLPLAFSPLLHAGRRRQDEAEPDRPLEPAIWTGAAASLGLVVVVSFAAASGWLPSAGWRQASARWLWGLELGIASSTFELVLGGLALWILLCALRLLVGKVGFTRVRGRRAA